MALISLRAQWRNNAEMETRFERITASSEALAAVLASIPTTDAPWDTAFERAFCASCALENCDDCPHKNVDRIRWWLGQKAPEPAEQLQDLINWDFRDHALEPRLDYSDALKPERTVRSYREDPDRHIHIRLYVGKEISEGKDLMNSIQAELIKQNRRRARHGGPVFSYRLELLAADYRAQKEEIEALMENLCDGYCRYTSAASGKTQDELLDICEGCPLSELRDLIGV